MIRSRVELIKNIFKLETEIDGLDLREFHEELYCPCYLYFNQPIRLAREFTNLQATGKTVLIDYKVEWHVSITFVGLISSFFSKTAGIMSRSQSPGMAQRINEKILQ